MIHREVNHARWCSQYVPTLLSGGAGCSDGSPSRWRIEALGGILACWLPLVETVFIDERVLARMAAISTRWPVPAE